MTKTTSKFDAVVNHLLTTPVAGLARRYSQLREALVNFERQCLWGGTCIVPTLVDYSMMQGDDQLRRSTDVRDDEWDAMLQFLHAEEGPRLTYTNQWYN